MRFITKNLNCLSRSRVVSFPNSKKPYIPEVRTKFLICLLSASFSSGTRNPINIMSNTDAIRCGDNGNAGHSFSKSLWDGSDKIGFGSLDHPGYSVESNADNFTGGWHAHQKVWDENDAEPSDWIKELTGDITKFDYESMEIGRAPRILVLYGSLRPTSFSRKCGMFRDLDILELCASGHDFPIELCYSFVVLALIFLFIFLHSISCLDQHFTKQHMNLLGY